LGKVARPGGLELPTFWFVARRSIQLSYGRTSVSVIESSGYSNLPRFSIRIFENRKNKSHGLSRTLGGRYAPRRSTTGARRDHRLKKGQHLRGRQALRFVDQISRESWPGIGDRRLHSRSHGLDAIIVGYNRGEDLVYVARVRNGFVPASRRQVFGKLRSLEVPDCPFVNLPETHKGRWGDGLTGEDMRQWFGSSLNSWLRLSF
jgi:hypothetical protein